VTTPNTREGTEISIRAVYQQPVYSVDLMNRYFAAINLAWLACVGLDRYRHFGAWLPSVGSPRSDADAVRGRRPAWLPSLYVQRLNINSPMEITFAVEGGVAAIGVYATYLLARVLKSPESVGAWLPRLVAGWHQGMQEVDEIRAMRRAQNLDQKPVTPEKFRDVRHLVEASNGLTAIGMKAEEVFTTGVDAFPDDLDDLETS
jgi:hypothetical protein